MWSVDAAAFSFEAIKSIPASNNFIYTMSILPPNPEENTWISAGEDSEIKIFSGDEVHHMLEIYAGSTTEHI